MVRQTGAVQRRIWAVGDLRRCILPYRTCRNFTYATRNGAVGRRCPAHKYWWAAAGGQAGRRHETGQLRRTVPPARPGITPDRPSQAVQTRRPQPFGTPHRALDLRPETLSHSGAFVVCGAFKPFNARPCDSGGTRQADQHSERALSRQAHGVERVSARTGRHPPAAKHRCSGSAKGTKLELTG